MEENNEITPEKMKLQRELEELADIELYCKIHHISVPKFWRKHLWETEQD